MSVKSPMAAEGLRFRSKVDAWLVGLLTAAVGVMWGAPLQRMWGSGHVSLRDLAVPAMVTAFLAWLLAATYYVVTDTELLVRSGPLRKTIPLQDVRRLRATRNPLSSPALSLDRIEVTYGSKWVLLSPRDRRGFVKAIQARIPTVVIEGLPDA